MEQASSVTSASGAHETITLGITPLSIADVVRIARARTKVDISEEAITRMRDGRTVVDEHANSDRAIYGVSTGFGALASVKIDAESRDRLQLSLIRSHAAGTGPEVEPEVVRALMLLRLQTFTTGKTGVRPEVAQRYVEFLNANLTPIVHEYGSLGCSGDLAPLAHCALAVIGEGPVRTAHGDLLSGAEAVDRLGLEPLKLAPKEGLALINGTDGMLGMLALAIHDLELILQTADISAAMSVEALLGTDRVFAADVQAARDHPGQRASAQNLVALLADSAIVASHRGPDCSVVQDAYSLRCAPQVAGAARDTLAHATTVAKRELASAVDNPVLLPDGRIESNGNFHGAPVAAVLDFLAISAADMASISERRTDRLLDSARSNGLPPFLAEAPGLDSGMMIAQYTQAAMVSELKRLAVPSSVDSIPSSAMQEDHVSMGWSAARKLRRSVDALRRVVSIEVLASTAALEFRAPLQPSPASAQVINLVRESVAPVGSDRWLSPDITKVNELVESGAVVAAAESIVGALA